MTSDITTSNEFSPEDAPNVIGAVEDATQQQNAVRSGYAAFRNDEPPSANPYRHDPHENFSGFKERKKKLWAQGWKLAAVRDGGYQTLDAVIEAHDIHEKTPRAPRRSLYDRGGGSPSALDAHQPHLYRAAGEWYRTRHAAAGAAARAANSDTMPGFGDDARDVVAKHMDRISVHERLRPPVLAPIRTFRCGVCDHTVQTLSPEAYCVHADHRVEMNRAITSEY